MTMEILMPAASPTMEDGTIARWLVRSGDRIERGDVLAEVETDKATLEVEAIDEGWIGEILVPEGTEGVLVGCVIATIVSEGVTVTPRPIVTAAPGPQPQPGPGPERPAAQVIREADVAAATLSPRSGLSPLASPLAQRLAEQRGVDLGRVTGSGNDGRIIMRDLQSRMKGPAALTAPLAEHHSGRTEDGTHFYTIEALCPIDALEELRERLNGRSGDKNPKLSLSHFLLKAFADTAADSGALGEHRSIDIDWIQLSGEAEHPRVHLSNIGGKSVSAIALAARCDGADTAPARLAYLSLGRSGLRAIHPVSDPANAIALAAGSAEPRMTLVDGRPTTEMTLTLVGRFRLDLVDLPNGVRMMTALRDRIARPLTILT